MKYLALSLILLLSINGLIMRWKIKQLKSEQQELLTAVEKVIRANDELMRSSRDLRETQERAMRAVDKCIKKFEWKRTKEVQRF